jgi:hypothetical protein
MGPESESESESMPESMTVMSLLEPEVRLTYEGKPG